MTDNKARTLDGSRTSLADLNTDAPFAEQAADPADGRLRSRLFHAWKNLSLVMAGMYTGLNCYGTPHQHHSYDSDQAGVDGSAKKPDKRPI